MKLAPKRQPFPFARNNSEIRNYFAKEENKIKKKSKMNKTTEEWKQNDYQIVSY